MTNFADTIEKDKIRMIIDIKHMNYQHGFDIDTFLAVRSPKNRRGGEYWDEVHLEFDEVTSKFRQLLETNEQVFDKKGNPLTPRNLYILIEEYKIRIQKLMLIFNLKLFKTYNENKKTGSKYVVMRAFWIDHKGKNVRWFSKNVGPKDKVEKNDEIPVHLLNPVEDYILYIMWEQYLIDYHGGDQVTTIDSDGNNIIVN